MWGAGCTSFGVKASSDLLTPWSERVVKSVRTHCPGLLSATEAITELRMTPRPQDITSQGETAACAVQGLCRWLVPEAAWSHRFKSQLYSSLAVCLGESYLTSLYLCFFLSSRE